MKRFIFIIVLSLSFQVSGQTQISINPYDEHDENHYWFKLNSPKYTPTKYQFDNYGVFKVTKVFKDDKYHKYELQIIELYKGDINTPICAVDPVLNERFLTFYKKYEKNDTVVDMLSRYNDSCFIFGFDEVPDGRISRKTPNRLDTSLAYWDTVHYPQYIKEEFEEAQYVFIGKAISVEWKIDTLLRDVVDDFVVREVECVFKVKDCLKCDEKEKKITTYSLPKKYGGYSFVKGETYLVYAKEEKINLTKRLRVNLPYTYTVHQKYAEKQIDIIERIEKGDN